MLICLTTQILFQLKTESFCLSFVPKLCEISGHPSDSDVRLGDQQQFLKQLQVAYQQTHQMLLNLRVGKTVSNPLKIQHVYKKTLAASVTTLQSWPVFDIYVHLPGFRKTLLPDVQPIAFPSKVLQDFLGKLGQKHLLRPSRENSYWSGDRILEKTYIHTGIHEYVSHYVFTFAKITCHMYTVFIYTYTCNIYTYAYTHTHMAQIYIYIISVPVTPKRETQCVPRNNL